MTSSSIVPNIPSVSQRIDQTFDYAIIGAGAAGLQLVLAMLKQPYFGDKSILILDKDPKEKNDKTWCFWEKGSGTYDAILHHVWEEGLFQTDHLHKPFHLHPYRYKMLRSIDFYDYAKQQIAQFTNVLWLEEEVQTITGQTIKGKTQHYQAQHIFDSRVDQQFHQKEDEYLRILQPFKGWFIETEEDAFDPSTFSMMDFRLRFENRTSFTYVLPFTPRKALIEFTLFSENTITSENFDHCLKTYVHDFLKLKKYRIESVEEGVVQMSNYPFQQHHQKHLTKIGIGGGWVKPSTGYSFKNAENKAEQIVQNILKGRAINHNLYQKKFRMYDTLLLDILKRKNERGPLIFEAMFRNNPPTKILKFLDEDTNFLEELRIMISVQKSWFLEALGQQAQHLWKV